MCYYDVWRSCRCLFWSRYYVYDLWYSNGLGQPYCVFTKLFELFFREFSSTFFSICTPWQTNEEGQAMLFDSHLYSATWSYKFWIKWLLNEYSLSDFESSRWRALVTCRLLYRIVKFWSKLLRGRLVEAAKSTEVWTTNKNDWPLATHAILNFSKPTLVQV